MRRSRAALEPLAHDVRRFLVQLVVGADRDLAEQPDADELEPDQHTERREDEERVARDIVAGEVLHQDRQRQGEQAGEERGDADLAEDLDRPRGIADEELDVDQVEDDRDDALEAVLAAAGDARAVAHWHLRDADAHPRGERGDEAVHLAVEADAAQHLAAVGLQGAAVVVQAHVGDLADQPVGGPARDAARQPRVLAVLAPAADHVVAFVNLREQQGDFAGIVLQVAVHRADHVAGGGVEPGRERRGLPEIPPQPEDRRARVARARLDEPRVRVVGRAVVHEDHLGDALLAVRERAELAAERLDVHRFVMERHDDADSHGRSFPGRPQMATRPPPKPDAILFANLPPVQSLPRGAISRADHGAGSSPCRGSSASMNAPAGLDRKNPRLSGLLGRILRRRGPVRLLLLPEYALQKNALGDEGENPCRPTDARMRGSSNE